MPYKYLGRIIRVGKAWRDAEGNLHPSNWNSGWSEEEKTAHGLTWEDEPQPYDNRFYWGRDAEGALIEKALEDVDAVDEDGNPVLDENGVQIVTKGLKSNAISQVKATAAGLLQPTDWYVTRKAETATAIPSAVLDYRAAVRTASGTIETAILGATTHDAFMALYDVPVDDEGNPTGNAPINDWPESL